MNGAVLTARSVWLEYPAARGPVTVLRGVDFDLARGGRACLLGPSGSGKSSLLMVLAGLLRPTRGQVLHDGEPWPADADAAASRRRRRIGLVFQEPFLVPYLTLRENALAAALDRGAGDRLAAKAERLGLTDLLDERPARLSLGERQRGSILRALANDPDLVIADEPTANLDLPRALEVVALLTGALDAASLVMVTHDTRIVDGSFRVLELADGVLSPHSAPGANA
jgi:ABC-type lipoprotein export system ATPase subunit